MEIFFPHITVPKWVQCVESRDLWKFDVEGTRELSSFLFYNKKFTVDSWYDTLQLSVALGKYENYIDSPLQTQKLIIETGKIMLQVQDTIVGQKTNVQYTKKIIFLGLNAIVINATEFMSEIGHTILEKNPDCHLAIIWRADHMKNIFCFSLRSREFQGLRVNCFEIAKIFGGGGHRPAAGFNLPMTTNLEEFLILNEKEK